MKKINVKISNPAALKMQGLYLDTLILQYVK